MAGLTTPAAPSTYVGAGGLQSITQAAEAETEIPRMIDATNDPFEHRRSGK
jgi:hypothetical protein